MSERTKRRAADHVGARAGEDVMMDAVGKRSPGVTRRLARIAGAVYASMGLATVLGSFRAGLKWTILGGVAGVVATPSLVAFTTLVFRFPVPFGGYVSGPGGVIPATVAGVLFYGVFFGGLVVQASLGAAAGFGGARIGRPDERRMHWLCILSAVLAAECGVFFLAVLDWIIGPW